MQYDKQPIAIPGQIALLKKRGLIFVDENKAAHYLSNISYYRLRAYTYPFQDNVDPNHPFVKKISFDGIIEVYVFDRKLRILIFDALEKIEIALRTKIIYEYALAHGSHWYENPSFFRNQYRFVTDINKVYEEISRSTETFIKHYTVTYTNPVKPACWMTLEVVSMGLLSKLFENLKRGSEKKAVTTAFGLPNVLILESWMHSFSHLRNVCAHHSRLWNRRFTTTPQLPTYPTFTFLNNMNVHPNKLYPMLSCIIYILNIISPGHSFVTKFKELISHTKNVNLKEMGFPKNWEKEPIWQ
jgi:abortive infection bacteriophage resistance protein